VPAALLVKPRRAIIADRARKPRDLHTTLGEPCLRVGDQRRSDTRAARPGRHEKLIQLLTPEGAEAERRAGWPDNVDVREYGLQPIAKARRGAEAGHLERSKRRMRFVPDIVPQPREMIDLIGISGSNLHLQHP
jgi:hypothetical protein